MSKQVNSDKKAAQRLPASPGVYFFLDAVAKPIYIGKAGNLKARVSSYFLTNLAPKTRKMVKQAKYIKYIQTLSDFEALLLEAKLVRLHMPFYNSQLKDDKSPIYIGITKEEFPRVITLRKTQLKTVPLTSTFGPFTKTSSVRKILKLTRRVVPYATHKPTKRECIYHQIGLCDPCPSIISTTKQKEDYKENISRIKKILGGQLQTVRKKLTTQMQLYSTRQNFEEAKNTLQKITMLDYITTPTTSVDEYLDNPNLIEDVRDSEQTSLASYLAPLGVTKVNRIECFDVAHLAGTSPTASMVTFSNAQPEKKYYRHFKIRKAKARDDYGALREVFERRMKRFADWGKPDLIIVDGGKGQLAVALAVFGEKVPVVGLAKRFETLIIRQAGVYKSINLPSGPAKNLVVRLRNEAHRFARRLHHHQVAKTLQTA